MNTIGIYKITSPTGRIYVGQSCNIEKRFNTYGSKNTKTQIKLYRSFKKYGIKNHTFEIIEECDEKELNNRERHYQDLYNVTSRKGLNCKLTKSDDKSGFTPQAIKDKISKSNKGRKVSNETKLKMSESGKIKIFTENHKINLKKALINRKLSDEYLEKLRLNNKKLKSKKVIDIITKVIYFSAKECASINNINYGTLKNWLNPNNKQNNKTNFKYLENEII